MNSSKLIIIGSGPAGLTAAIYAARNELQPILLAGTVYGGQLMLTTEVGNFPGFVEDILGPDLIQRMIDQAKRFGAEIVLNDVVKVDFSKHPFKLWTDDQAYEAQSVIMATGASAKWLGLASEERLRGKGVSSCATCDGYFFKGKKVVVVGGGDVAMEDSNFLTKYAAEVTIVHRRDTLRASKILQKRAFDNPKIKFIWNTEIADILGEDHVTGVKLRNLKTTEEQNVSLDGVFIAIGHEPNTKFLQNSGLKLDQKGYIVPKEHSRTNIEGVFVAGDVHDYIYRQAITAAGEGARAAIDAEKWLAEQK
jgi:thioredoxin reductase (NADPH)